MKNDNFYKILRIVCLILAIVCMALSLFKKAKAEEMEYKYNDYFTSIFKEYSNYNEIAPSWNICKQYCNDFKIIYYDTVESNDGVYIFSSSGCSFCTSGEYSTSNITNNGKYEFTVSREYYLKMAIFDDVSDIFNYDNKNCVGMIFICRQNNISVQLAYINSYSATSVYIIDYGNYNCYRGQILFHNLINKGNMAYVNNIYRIKQYDTIFCTYYGSYSNYVKNTKQDTVLDVPDPIINNTEGFDVYKYGSSGSERLVCDFSNCISISNAVGNSSNIQIEIDIDGIDQTFNFDSTSTYYDYSVPSNRAIYSFPFSVFGINNETISAKLKGVNIENITSSPGGTELRNIFWITPLTLVGSDYEDLEPEIIPKEQMPDFDYYDNPTTQTSYNGTMNRWLTSAYSSFDYSLFTRWNFSPKYLVIGVEPYNASQALKDSLADFIRAIGNLEFGNALAEAITVGQGKTLQEQITEYLNDHLYITDLYDIIVFGYLPSENGTMQYYIYTTDSYNNHLNNSLMYDLLQAVSDDGKAIEKTYDYLYDRLNDFEDKTLTKLNELVGLQELENGFISSLQSILNQILNALLNLNIEFPEADYTDILEKLDTIIDNQDTSDINDDWYQNYREWLYGINENDSYMSPHEYFNNIFGTLKTTFDSFTNNISFNAYLLKVEDLINHISGSTSDNLTIYLRDGIGDPGFNINNNYMYTVGGKP